MPRREWLKMEYPDRPYVVGSVLELPGIGWALLHCASKTVMHESSPAGVDLGTAVYMQAEGISNYVVHIADSGRWLVAKLEQLVVGRERSDLQRKGVIFGSGAVRNRIYLPWSSWVVVPHPAGWQRITTSDIPYLDETRITEDGAVKWRSTHTP